MPNSWNSLSPNSFISISYFKESITDLAFPKKLDKDNLQEDKLYFFNIFSNSTSKILGSSATISFVFFCEFSIIIYRITGFFFSHN